eukprot:CAMPEP_0171771912 /NCGR_PEP_ID=MMETSP0991-20121206/54385_1 /TAXON_ID=483369 /ORGANISM="non described non described, Strain CCMP2098" /LENGTH=36 /DNA_ID= /DNA_START= /DNA_END= /DNA_ORIENTATION=
MTPFLSELAMGTGVLKNRKAWSAGSVDEKKIAYGSS